MTDLRTERISQRDLQVLEFIARFGVVSREAVAIWAGTARTSTLARERRLRDAGLIEVRCGVWGEGKLAGCTAAGIALCGRGDLRRPRFSLATVRHDVIASELAAALERQGARVLSEREIVAREREEDGRPLSAELPETRFHRPDLVRIDPDCSAPEAIEVELTAKGTARLDVILRGWRWAVAEGRLAAVRYYCAPRVCVKVRRAVDRSRSGDAVSVERLPDPAGGQAAVLGA